MKILFQERKMYLPLAEFGSTLFFLIAELRKMNNMYCFSLISFFKLFNQALETSAVRNSQFFFSILFNTLFIALSNNSSSNVYE